MTDTTDRTPPQRIRITKLQESQVEDLVQLEHACAAMYYELGFDAAEVPTRTYVDISHLPRHHNVFVAEADHEVAGYLAWRDESPGVAYLEELSVHPRFHRFGVGTQLLQAMEEDALRCNLHDVVARMFEKAAWAKAFYTHHGFQTLGEQASHRVLSWKEERSSGRPLTRPGEVVMWKSLRAQCRSKGRPGGGRAGRDAVGGARVVGRRVPATRPSKRPIREPSATRSGAVRARSHPVPDRLS